MKQQLHKKISFRGKCEYCKKWMTKTKWNQKFHPLPWSCKNSAANVEKKKHADSIRKDIRNVMDGKLSIHAIHHKSVADKKLIRSTFKKAGFIY